MANIRISPRDARSLRADHLVVPVRPRGDAMRPWSPAWRGGAAQSLTAALSAVRAVTDQGAVHRLTGIPGPVPGSGGPVVMAVVITEDADLEGMRRAIGAAVRESSGRVVVDLTGLPGEPADLVGAGVEAAALGAYRFDEFRQNPPNPPVASVSTVTLTHPQAQSAAARKAAARARTVAAGVNRTRDLVNMPPSTLNPVEFAARVTEAASGTSITVRTTSGAALKRAGFGGITAVGQGSANQPALVRMHYKPRRPVARIALVGKGITFDSGGLSLKTPQGMMTMKSDMAGAAAVAQATVAVAELGLPVELVTYLACAENMPSGTAQRPGDVITIYGGTTVEVLNTDAEGRLVLADALVKAAEDEPDAIIDVATLTGAQVIALGSRIGAAMGRTGDLRDDFLAASDEAGESFWPMPLPRELRASLDSKIADLANIGERNGGMMTAAVFLAEFVPEQVPWLHLDIAGPSFNEGAARDYTPAGGTGVAVRSLVRLIERIAEQGGLGPAAL